MLYIDNITYIYYIYQANLWGQWNKNKYLVLLNCKNIEWNQWKKQLGINYCDEGYCVLFINHDITCNHANLLTICICLILII